MASFSNEMRELFIDSKDIDSRVSDLNRKMSKIGQYDNSDTVVSLGFDKKNSDNPKEQIKKTFFDKDIDTSKKVDKKDETIIWDSQAFALSFASDNSVLRCSLMAIENDNLADWKSESPKSVISEKMGIDGENE